MYFIYMSYVKDLYACLQKVFLKHWKNSYVTNLFGDVVDNHGMLLVPAEELIFGDALLSSLKCYQRNSFKSGQKGRNGQF